MGEADDYNVAVLAAYCESMVFKDMEIDEGIRHFLKDFRLPEAQKVDRMMEKFMVIAIRMRASLTHQQHLFFRFPSLC